MTYSEIKKKWIETITVAETQYDYIKVLESLLDKHNIPYDEVEQDEEFNKLNRLDIETVTDVVCEYYKIPKEEVLGKSQRRLYVCPRQVICYISKLHVPFITLNRIGGYLGDRDHSTVVHSIQVVKDELGYKKSFNRDIKNIIEILRI
jgi:chromosomal replication initiation ATPase DnaA